VRELLNNASVSRPTVQNIATAIGRTIEYEQRIRAWENGSKKDRALLMAQQQDLRRDKASSGHKRRVNINRFNHHLKYREFEQVEWTPWTTEQLFRVGWEVMDAVIRYTGWFEVVEDPDHHPRATRGPKSPMHVLIPKAGLMDWLKNALDRAELAQPEFRPTIVPPKPWDSSRNGGYWTPYARSGALIRKRADQENQREGAADEYDALDMPEVYKAINTLQATAYRVNTRVLEVFGKVWTELRWSRDKAYLPELSERELPPVTPRMMEHREANRGLRGDKRSKPDPVTEEEIKQWKRKAAPIHAFNATRNGRTREASALLRLATEYAKFDAFYFPHMLDWRGRYYPIPNYLHPQGNDLARGLLTYAEGMPITEANGGIRWLAIHVASTWGLDKKPFNERVQWVYDNEQFLRDIASDPYSHDRWFTEGDKPWEFLAAAYEWVDYLDATARGEELYSSLPIMVDGTCNGIQHLSAIIRDAVGGKLVNLLPGEAPRDIYKHVAADLQEVLEDIERGGGPDAHLATWWLELCDRDLPRDLTKRQVMVLPYGGTKDSFFTYTRAWLDKKAPLTEDQQGDPEAAAERTKQVIFMATLMWDSVKRNVKAAEKVMGWLQDCAKVAAQANQPIFWIAPSGFVVRHFYGAMKSRSIDMRLDGERIQVKVSERGPTLSVKEQLRGIAPNFIHSLDAACLTICVNKCAEAGISAFTSVHDAYGTHAANMDALSVFLREAFVETHEVDVLGLLREACLEVVIPVLMLKDKDLDPLEAFEKANAMLPAPLENGDLDTRAVLNSDYFFA
jgi:DNA-directed RNA polymerase, mitochondrial